MNIIGTAHVKQEVLFTENLFGSLKEIAGKNLDVVDRNPSGDCLCVVKGPDGVAKYLVDVKHPDISSYTSSNLWNVMEAFARERKERKRRKNV